MSAGSITIRAVDNWNKRIDVPLHNALQATIELTGKSGREACVMAMVYMARSAARLTRIARKLRPVLRDGRKEYVETFDQSGGVRRVYRWQANERGWDWERVKRVGRRGLARRSWFWSLPGRKATGGAIPGATTLDEYVGRDTCGFTMTNRLKYIRANQVTPDSIEHQAAASASNQIMAQAARKMERQFGVVVPRLAAQRAKRAAARLDREWKKAAGSGARGAA